MLVWAVLIGFTGLMVESARPDPPISGITTVGSKKLATAEDCSGVVAFSAATASKSDNRLLFQNTLVNKGVGYIAETGIFTTHCPGLYQFSFAGYGSNDLKLILKRKTTTSNGWSPIVSTGSTGGGANLVLLDCEAGDQIAVFIDSGKSNEGTTFSGYRVAKK